MKIYEKSGIFMISQGLLLKSGKLTIRVPKLCEILVSGVPRHSPPLRAHLDYDRSRAWGARSCRGMGRGHGERSRFQSLFKLVLLSRSLSE